MHRDFSLVTNRLLEVVLRNKNNRAFCLQNNNGIILRMPGIA
jgi:hypothetical protein